MLIVRQNLLAATESGGRGGVFGSLCAQQVTFRILLGNKDIIEEVVFVFSYRSLGYEYKCTAIQAGSVYFMLLL